MAWMLSTGALFRKKTGSAEALPVFLVFSGSYPNQILIGEVKK